VAPTLGVVVPTLDESERIAALLERLLDPRRGADAVERVVVSDGGSRDATRELARRFGARVLEGPRGRGAQLAAGARELGTDVLIFLHADCMPEDGAIERVRVAFEDQRLTVAAMHQRVDAHGVFFRCVEAAADRRVAWLGVVYGDSALCVRRDAYEGCGGFREVPLFEDVELSRRLRSVARPRLIAGARVLVSARRWRTEGALRATLRNWMLLAAYSLGVAPQRLTRFYPSPSRATSRT
jgi:rSAM/selenodomain-associated transferase 2